MKPCDICGAERGTKKCIVNVSLLELCDSCIKREDVIEVKPCYIEENVSKLEMEEDNEMIIPNYAEVIKNAREKLGISIGDLARELLEKVRDLQEIEKGKLVPSFLLAKKICKILNINLFDSYKRLYPPKSEIDFRKNNLKIRDLLKTGSGAFL